MIKLPLNNKWTQPNNSDKFGSLAYTKNISLDKDGYLKLSPRTVNIFDDSSNTTGVADTDFNVPSAIGRYANGSFRVVTIAQPFDVSLADTDKTIAENTASSNPNYNANSHGVWWQNKWYVTDSSDKLASYDGSSWTANIVTFANTKRHYMAVFKNRQTLCVSDGNLVKQYNTDHSSSTTLTIPSDFEIVGMAYNNNKMGIITRLGSDSEAQGETYFFTWDGATTSANTGVGVGSYQCLGVVAYKSSFAIITVAGQLLYWNGGGFDVLATFPFYFDDKLYGDLTTLPSYGDVMVVDGEKIYINIGLTLQQFSIKDETISSDNQGGIWCYSPSVGLHHCYSASISPTYEHLISQANINTTTDIFTTSKTIPATGNPIILTNGVVGGLKKGVVYYVIKLSSTTFQIAETREKALASVYIDITSADTNQWFWLTDLKDYGTTYMVKNGAVALFGTRSHVFRDVIFGNTLENTSLSNTKVLNMAVPYLENRGYFVTPKIFTDSVRENIQKIYIKHRPLNVNDSIIVKVKEQEYIGVPTSSPNASTGSELVWTGAKDGYTNSDLSEIKELFDNGVEFEMEIIAGVGAGQMVKITNIDEANGTYALEFNEPVLSASAGLKSYFIIDNWKTCASVDYDTQKDGVFEVPVGKVSKAPQFKIELRGYQTTIEEATFIHKPHNLAV